MVVNAAVTGDGENPGGERPPGAKLAYGLEGPDKTVLSDLPGILRVSREGDAEPENSALIAGDQLLKGIHGTGPGLPGQFIVGAGFQRFTHAETGSVGFGCLVGFRLDLNLNEVLGLPLPS